MHSVDLPQPTAEEIEHSRRVTEFIVQDIQAAGGWIDFARYMELALYAPGLGYYAAGLQKFGAQGDFITAPEISPLFAHALAAPVAQVLASMPGASVLEFGAGSGALAADLLLALETQQQLPRHYFILELSGELKYRQQQTLLQRAPHLLSRVHWLDALPQQALNAVVIANEVLDAMPVQRFIKTSRACELLGVSVQQNELIYARRPCDSEIVQSLERIEQDIEQPLSPEYHSELNLHIAPWIQSVFDVLVQGVVLLIDYGYARREYYLPERSMGTFLCYYRHRANDNALWYPGLQDMTAFVDFTAVAEAAVAAGFELEGFTSQANFLMDCGLARVPTEHASMNDKAWLQQSQQIKTLTLAGEMGEHFKVMGLSKNYVSGMPGFGLRDYSYML